MFMLPACDPTADCKSPDPQPKLSAFDRIRQLTPLGARTARDGFGRQGKCARTWRRTARTSA